MHFLLRTTLVAVWLLAASAAPLSAAEGESSPAGKSGSPKPVEYETLKLAELVRRANANDLRAQFELGSRFNYGREAPKNVKEALRWLRRAGQAGQRDAQRLLAVKFYNGHDVPVDHDEAFRWTQRMAEAGDFPAQMALAGMYANGEGGPRNLVRAYMWYDIAAVSAQKAIDPPDQSAVARAAEMRDKTAELLLPAEEVEAQQLASDWWLKKQDISLTPKAVQKKQPAAKPGVAPKKPETAAKP